MTEVVGMAVVNHPSPPHNWRDGDGNVDWDAYADEVRWRTEDVGNGRSISRGYGGCATCDGGGCGDCA